MAKFEVKQDIAIIDKGLDNSIGERFVAITDVEVDDNGSLSNKSNTLVRRSLSAQAIKSGASRINQSDCVDASEGGLEATDDQILVFNGGDIIYTSLQSGLSYEKFMIKQGLLVPSKK